MSVINLDQYDIVETRRDLNQTGLGFPARYSFRISQADTIDVDDIRDIESCVFEYWDNFFVVTAITDEESARTYISTHIIPKDWSAITWRTDSENALDWSIVSFYLDSNILYINSSEFWSDYHVSYNMDTFATDSNNDRITTGTRVFNTPLEIPYYKWYKFSWTHKREDQGGSCEDTVISLIQVTYVW